MPVTGSSANRVGLPGKIGTVKILRENYVLIFLLTYPLVKGFVEFFNKSFELPMQHVEEANIQFHVSRYV